MRKTSRQVIILRDREVYLTKIFGVVPKWLRGETANLLYGGSIPPDALRIINVHHSRKYSLNELFFDKWTPEMAYVLGFWFADGYMRKEKSYRVIFYSNDEESLLQIRDALDSTSPVQRWRDDDCFHLIVMSKYLFSRLKELGGMRAKSKNIRFPEIPRQYLRDFIRGYFDGDGSVFWVNYHSTKDGRPRRELRSNFTSGSKDFLEKLMGILYDEIGLAVKQISSYNNGSSLKLGYGTKDTRRLLSFIYYPSFTLGLKRKSDFLKV